MKNPLAPIVAIGWFNVIFFNVTQILISTLNSKFYIDIVNSLNPGNSNFNQENLTSIEIGHEGLNLLVRPLHCQLPSITWVAINNKLAVYTSNCTSISHKQ